MAYRYRNGYTWRNSRGQVFIQAHEHPRARLDGFYPRAKLVMEDALFDGSVRLWRGELNPVGQGPLSFADLTPHLLRPNERVLHLDGNPSNDDPTNLMLFPSQRELSQWRSKQYHASKDQDYRDRLKGLTAEQIERRQVMGTKRAQSMEKRSAAAKRAHKLRKARKRKVDA